MTDRCKAQTDYQGDGPVSHKIRCDLTDGHKGQHELRNRSDDSLVTNWEQTAAATGPSSAHVREEIEALVVSAQNGGSAAEVADEILTVTLAGFSTDDLMTEIGARAGRSFLEAFKGSGL